MVFRRPVGAKGQVVIPRDIRQLLGVRPGGEVVFEIRDNHVSLRKPDDALAFVADFLAGPKLKKPISPREIKAAIVEQYDEELPRH
jgi:AbrB family looped-hinge helix DNA binding protein